MARHIKRPKVKKVKVRAETSTQRIPWSTPEDPPRPLSPPLPIDPPPPLSPQPPCEESDAERETQAPPAVEPPPKTHPLLNLPPEVIDLILQHTLTYASAIPVDPLFNKHNAYIPPPLDYRILHSCRELYLTGLRHYYILNIFSISLSLFSTAAHTVAADRWPHACGLGCASLFVRTLHVSAREYRNWKDSVKLLKGFEGLQKVVFDVREDWSVDSAVDGGVSFDGGWAEVPADAAICDALTGAGMRVGAGGIWVGADTADTAALIMGGLLVDAIAEGCRG